MDLKLKALSTHSDPAGTTVTLALDLSHSGRLPETTRVFLKDQVYENLASEARPEKARDVLRKISRRIRDFVENTVRPETDGLFLVAGPGLWETVELRVPLRNLIVVDRAPYLAPLIEAARRAPRAYVVELGARGGHIEEVFLGESVRTMPLEFPKMPDDVQHAVAPHGGAERDLRQRHLLEASRTMAREAAARVAALHREAPAETIFLTKPSRVFVDHLPGDLRKRVAPLGREGVTRALENAYAAKVAREWEELKDAPGAARGPRDVLKALASGKAKRVFLNPDDPRPGVACVDCDGLFQELHARCPSCEGDVVGASMTQEIVAHALAHPRLELTFVSAPDLAALPRTRRAGVLAR